jgi:adenosylcobinamide kinase / adenosylcobinamide-phosphate guanylyltransferase
VPSAASTTERTARVLTMLIGGARSGKSALAVELAGRHDGGVTYVATSPRIHGDVDLDARIAEHRAERPPHWRTIEEERNLQDAMSRAGDDLVVVDCLTLWVSNRMWAGDDDSTIAAIAGLDADAAAARPAPTIVISNEVGLGVHPSSDAGRRYRDVLGRVNQRWCVAAERSLLMVAGRALPLVDPRTLLP